MSKRFVSLVAFASLVVVACSDDPKEAPADAGVDVNVPDVADTSPPIDANAYLCDCVKWEGPTGDLCPSTPDAGPAADASADADATVDASADATTDASDDANGSGDASSDASSSADASPSADASADASGPSDASADAGDSGEAGGPVASFAGNVRWQNKCSLPCGVYPLRVCSGGGCVSIQQDFCAKDFIPAKFDCVGTASPQVYVIFDSGASCQVR